MWFCKLSFYFYLFLLNNSMGLTLSNYTNSPLGDDPDHPCIPLFLAVTLYDSKCHQVTYYKAISIRGHSFEILLFLNGSTNIVYYKLFKSEINERYVNGKVSIGRHTQTTIPRDNLPLKYDDTCTITVNTIFKYILLDYC